MMTTPFSSASLRKSASARFGRLPLPRSQTVDAAGKSYCECRTSHARDAQGKRARHGQAFGVDGDPLMTRVKLILQVAGIIIGAIGLLCFPLGFGTNPKRDLNGFDNLADIGMFVRPGLILLGAGGIILGVS